MKAWTTDGKQIEVTQEQLDAAQRVHLYSFENVLRPRGRYMAKEGLGLCIFEKLQSAFESWTDPVYGENPSREVLMKTLGDNARAALQAALEALDDLANRGTGSRITDL